MGREGNSLGISTDGLINRAAEFRCVRVSHRLVRCLKNDTSTSFPSFTIPLESVPAI